MAAAPPPRSPSAKSVRIRVAVVDDDPHFVLFLESVFGASARHELAVAAGTAEEAERWPVSAAPDVALLDVELPGAAGSALVAKLLKKFPRLLVIMLTAHADESPVLESIRAGAVGYLLKGVDKSEILAAIDDALAGGAPMSPAIARKVLGLMQRAPGAPPAAGREAAALAGLTPREREVLEHVAAGGTDKDVAERLGLARSTVKNCLLGIYTKWRINSRTGAAVKFVRAGGAAQ